MENSYMKQICYLRLKNDYSEKKSCDKIHLSLGI